MDVYVVDVCAITGEWLSEPEFSRVESREDFFAHKDDDGHYYCTYEYDPDGYPPSAETRGLVCKLVR